MALPTKDIARIVLVQAVDDSGAPTPAGSDATAANQVLTNSKLDAVNSSLDAIEAAATDTDPVEVILRQDEYETVAASQTDQVLGATGAANDYLAGLLIVPTTTTPGVVSIKDGSGGSAITVFTGGAGSVSNLVPFFAPLGIRCTSAGWRVTTGANVSVIAVGDFT